MIQNDVKWIVRKILACAVACGTEESGQRDAYLHSVMAIRDRVWPRMTSGPGVRTPEGWGPYKDYVLQRHVEMAPTFYRKPVNDVLLYLAAGESREETQAWWRDMCVETVSIPGH